MSIFSFFKNENESDVKKYSALHEKLQKEYPSMEEKELVITSCVAGLLARVAYVDFELDPGEMEQIKETLKNWSISSLVHSDLIAVMAIDHIKEMAGLENHLYVHPLKEHLNSDDRFKLLKALFILAASDGEVASVESEEIRTITKGLELSNQHFLAARAEVATFLKALK